MTEYFPDLTVPAKLDKILEELTNLNKTLSVLTLFLLKGEEENANREKPSPLPNLPPNTYPSIMPTEEFPTMPEEWKKYVAGKSNVKVEMIPKSFGIFLATI